jgi:hypothetical protein
MKNLNEQISRIKSMMGIINEMDKPCSPFDFDNKEDYDACLKKEREAQIQRDQEFINPHGNTYDYTGGIGTSLKATGLLGSGNYKTDTKDIINRTKPDDSKEVKKDWWNFLCVYLKDEHNFKTEKSEISASTFCYSGLWVFWKEDKNNNSGKYNVTYGKNTNETLYFDLKYPKDTWTKGNGDNLLVSEWIMEEKLSNKSAPLFNWLDFINYIFGKSNEKLKYTVAALKPKEEFLKFWDPFFKPIIEDARNWWMDKLSEEGFWEKLQQVNQYTRSKTDYVIKNYKEIIKLIQIQAEDTRGESKLWFEKSVSTPYLGVFMPELITIGKIYLTFVQDFYMVGHLLPVLNVDYKNYTKDYSSTIVHELQHALWNFKPFNPFVKWKDAFPIDINQGTIDERAFYEKGGVIKAKNFPKIKQLEKINEKYKDISVDTLINLTSFALDSVLTNKGKLSGNFYNCDANEMGSRLAQIKQAFKLKTSDDIPEQMMINAINYNFSDKKQNIPKVYKFTSNPWVRILVCWARNGSPNIKTFLSSLNQLVAKNDNKLNNNKLNNFNDVA